MTINQCVEELLEVEEKRGENGNLIKIAMLILILIKKIIVINYKN